MTKLTENDVREIHDEVVEEFAFPTTEVIFHNQKDMPFFIDNNKVHLVLSMLKDDKFARSILRHEIGHMHYSPVSIRNHKICLENMKEIFKGFADYSFLSHLSNVFYDMIVDYNIKHNLNDDIDHRINASIDDIKPDKNNQYLGILMGYYNILGGREYMAIDKECKRLAQRCYSIVASLREHNKKIELLCNVLYDVAKRDSKNRQEMKDQMEKLREAISDMKGIQQESKTVPRPDENTGKDSRKITTIEDSTNAENKQDKVADMMDETSKSKSYSLGKALKVDLEQFDLLLAKAQKNIKFKLKVEGGMGGKTSAAGLFRWTTDDEIENLEIEETIQTSGVVIPEITTIQFEKKESTEVREVGIPQTYVCIDTSGSMDRNDTIIALFSFIEAAKYYGVQVGVVMFSDNAYFYREATSNYYDLEKECYDNFSSGGTSIISGAIKLDQIMNNKSLIVFITDWEDGPTSIDRTMELQQQWSKDNKIINVCMFDRNISKQIEKHLGGNIKAIACQNEKQLQDLLVKFINENVW